MKIGVFDSGIGGLSVLDVLRKNLFEYDFVYYGDSKNNPYGDKTEEELMGITKKIVEFLISKGCSLIVIACNTATTRCMKKLRIIFPNIIFVGIVPAIKVACDLNYKNILVMATESTVNSHRVSELINDNKKIDQTIYLEACSGLANAIEVNDKTKINELLHKYLNKYKSKNIDCIVLGCTHYPYIKKEIAEILPSNIIDGSDGVMREVKRQIEKNNLELNKNNQELVIYNSLTDDINL